MSQSASLKGSFDTLLKKAERFNELTIRERVCVSLAVLGITWAVWFYLVDSYFETQQAITARDVQMTREEAKVTEQKNQELARLAAKDPNEPVARELEAVRAKMDAMETNLQVSLSQFIPPSAMTLVLRDVMSDHKNLTLTLLSRLPARELLPEEENANLYLHPMRIELEGAYLDVLDYVQSLENGDWQFNWRSFDYKTKGYPNGVATIEIETLSKDKYWLGI